MDILTPIIIFYFYQLSQNIPILHDIFLLIAVFGFIAFVWIGLVFFMTLVTVVTVMEWFPHIYVNTCKLGVYHRLIERIDPFTETSHFGEYDFDKIKAVLKANFWVGLSLSVALIYILNSVPSSFFGIEDHEMNITINQSTPSINSETTKNLLPNGVFTITLLLIPSFLLSLRLLANPTENWIKIIVDCRNLSSIEIENKIRYFKDQVTSFYYSFIAGTIVLFYLSFLVTAYINNANKPVSFNVIPLLKPFLPTMDPLALFFFIVLEIIIVIITTLAGEWYLKIYPPIVQE